MSLVDDQNLQRKCNLEKCRYRQQLIQSEGSMLEKEMFEILFDHQKTNIKKMNFINLGNACTKQENDPRKAFGILVLVHLTCS